MRDPPVRVPAHSSSVSESMDLARKAVNDVRNPNVGSPMAVSLQMVLAVDLTGFSDGDEGVVEAENTLNGVLTTLAELRKPRKLPRFSACVPYH